MEEKKNKVLCRVGIASMSVMVLERQELDVRR